MTGHKPGDRLDKSTQLERTYGDVEPTNTDIERLCDAWAEVGKAILCRRQQRNDEEKRTEAPHCGVHPRF